MRYIQPETPGDREWNDINQTMIRENCSWEQARAIVKNEKSLLTRLVTENQLSWGEATAFVEGKRVLSMSIKPISDLDKARSELEALFSI